MIELKYDGKIFRMDFDDLGNAGFLAYDICEYLKMGDRYQWLMQHTPAYLKFKIIAGTRHGAKPMLALVELGVFDLLERIRRAKLTKITARGKLKLYNQIGNFKKWFYMAVIPLIGVRKPTDGSNFADTAHLTEVDMKEFEKEYNEKHGIKKRKPKKKPNFILDYVPITLQAKARQQIKAKRVTKNRIMARKSKKAANIKK